MDQERYADNTAGITYQDWRGVYRPSEAMFSAPALEQPQPQTQQIHRASRGKAPGATVGTMLGALGPAPRLAGADHNSEIKHRSRPRPHSTAENRIEEPH